MKKIAAFDSLRFIACIFIILHHTGINIYQFHKIDNPYFRTGGLAVEIFFVLSGFLLANSYLNSLSNHLNVGENCKQYFFRRIKRLYPEYIFAMLLCALLTNLFSHHVSMNTFMLNTVMMAGWGNIPNIINGIWYVVVLFWGGNILYNMLVFYKDKAVNIILPIIGCVCLFYLINHGSNISGNQRGIEFTLLSKGTIRGFLGLITGIYCFFICQIIQNIKIKFRKPVVSLVLFVLECVATGLLFNAVLLRKSQDISDFNIYFYISFLVGLLYFHQEKLLKFLSWKCWEKVSYLSYTIYLTHLILLEILRVHWKGLATMNPFVMYTVIICLSVLWGYVCYHAQKKLFVKLKEMIMIPQSVTGAKNVGNLERERERDSSC